MNTIVTPPLENDMPPQNKLELFKFYEDAAERTKDRAWTQTSWMLTLNSGVLGFSLTSYLQNEEDAFFLVIELLSAAVGVVLSLFLYYMLQELGSHIRSHWTKSNKIAADYSLLGSFMSKEEAIKAKSPEYSAGFPRFCRRLQQLAILFMLAHLGWFGFILAR
jgi:hypothetical protein